MLKYFRIKPARAEITRLENELSALTGQPVTPSARAHYHILTANHRITELLDAVSKAKAEKLSRGQSDAMPILAQTVFASVPTGAPISSPAPAAAPPLPLPWTGAKLSTLASMFPTLASRTFESESDKWDAVETEAHKAGLTIHGMRTTAELTAIYGEPTKPTTATAIATATLRQSALDSICNVAPRPALTKPTLAAPVVGGGGKLDTTALAGLVDAIGGDGTVARMLAKPLEIDCSADGLAARANAVQYSTHQTAAVRKEMQRRIQARQSSRPDNDAETKRALLSSLYHLGVRHAALDYTGIEPDESRVERNPRRVEIANRKAAAFLNALAGGTDVVSAADVGAVEAARELIRVRTGRPYAVGASYFTPEQKPHPFSTIPTH